MIYLSRSKHQSFKRLNDTHVTLLVTKDVRMKAKECKFRTYTDPGKKVEKSPYFLQGSWKPEWTHFIQKTDRKKMWLFVLQSQKKKLYGYARALISREWAQVQVLIVKKCCVKKNNNNIAFLLRTSLFNFVCFNSQEHLKESSTAAYVAASAHCHPSFTNLWHCS